MVSFLTKHRLLTGLIFFSSIIELAISAWLASRYNLRHDYLSTSVRDRNSFLLFTSSWTIFGCLMYALLVTIWSGGLLASITSHGVFIALTWIFWTAGAASITAALGGGLNCNGGFTYCGQLNALEAFAWLSWILVTFALVTVFIYGVTAARRGDGGRAPFVTRY